MIHIYEKNRRASNPWIVDERLNPRIREEIGEGLLADCDWIKFNYRHPVEGMTITCLRTELIDCVQIITENDE